MAFDTLAQNALKALTSSNLLGVSVDFLYENGEIQTAVNGVWNEQTETIDPATDSIITTQQPRLFVDLAQLDYPPRVNDRISRAANTYRVISVEPDGYNGAELFLQVTELFNNG